MMQNEQRMCTSARPFATGVRTRQFLATSVCRRAGARVFAYMRVLANLAAGPTRVIINPQTTEFCSLPCTGFLIFLSLLFLKVTLIAGAL